MRERMDDRETRRRLLEAAKPLVLERGMSTGLEHIVFEDVIRASGASRSSAYRQWPDREHFHAALLLELVRGTALPTATDFMLTTARDIIVARAADLTDPQKHRNMVVELLRVTLGADFTLMRDSREWSVFLSLITGHAGIGDSALRARVAAELQHVEQRSMNERARAYAEISSALGYRLAHPLVGPSGFDLMSMSAGATMFGLIAKRRFAPAAAEAARRLRAFGSTEVADWLPPIYAIASVVLSFIEPDPGVEWTEQHVEDLLQTIQDFPVSQSGGVLADGAGQA